MQNGSIFPATKLFKYPHMFPLDIAIWERFLDSHGADFLGFDYDVKVGSGTTPIEGLGDKYARMQSILSKFRIDVVGFKRNSIYIIETKPNASASAIGQVDTYTKLYTRDFTPTIPVIGCIVTDNQLPDMDYLTKEKGIEYYVV